MASYHHARFCADVGHKNSPATEQVITDFYNSCKGNARLHLPYLLVS